MTDSNPKLKTPIMKTFWMISMLWAITITQGFAQNVPQAMNYQAVARDNKGQVLPNEQLDLKVSLGCDSDGKQVEYSELHTITTNQLGLFTLLIGEGIPVTGSFKSIPWGDKEIWMRVDLKGSADADFITVSNTRLLSVPYAFHAGTASELIESPSGSRDNSTGSDPQYWNISGNSNTNNKNKLGTRDYTPLSIFTFNKERMKVTEDGDVLVNNNLTVDKKVELNKMEGNTIVNGDLSVENTSSTHLTGTLDVDKALNVDGSTTLNSSLMVANMAPTHLTGTLIVDMETLLHGISNVGPLNLHDSLNVLDMAPTHLTGILTVDKKAIFGQGVSIAGPLNLHDSLNVLNMAPTHLSGSLTIDNATILKNTLSLKSSNSGFVATFENTDLSDGDGIRIKLGKTHPRWMDNPPIPFSNMISAQVPGFTFLGAAVNATKGLIKDLMVSPATTFSEENFEVIGQELQDALETEMGASIETYASAACNLTKDLIGEINTSFDLPWNFPGLSTPVIHVSNSVTLFGGLDLGVLGSIPAIVVPAVNVPPATIINTFPVFPIIPAPSCPAPPSLSDWTLPNFRITNVPNSLSNENQYIQFVDKDNRQVGTIRAASIEDWCSNYLGLTYFLNVFNSFAGVTVIGIDPSQIAETLGKYAINGLAVIANVSDAYNSIGVEYSSGFGDYAEWLERADPGEIITPGDIVAVKGGKITREIVQAEQVFAVSSNPIVLGNTPPEGKDYMGNKVAFMGQIPVKIMGPVVSGDFIVANGDVPGYGVAIHPSQMTPQEMALSVGRSWETVEGQGPKMINTVVGIHNGDYIHILQQYQHQLQETDLRLSAIEQKMELLFPAPLARTGSQ